MPEGIPTADTVVFNPHFSVWPLSEDLTGGWTGGGAGAGDGSGTVCHAAVRLF